MPITLVAMPNAAHGLTHGMWLAPYPGAYRASEFIEANATRFRGLRVTDVGTGSGYTAIAAALAGAEYVLAVDSDPEALRATDLNAAANGVSHIVETRLGDITSRQLYMDANAQALVAADTFYNPIITRGLVGQLLREAQRGKAILATSSDNLLPRLKEIGEDISEDTTGPNGLTLFVHGVWVPPQRKL